MSITLENTEAQQDEFVINLRSKAVDSIYAHSRKVKSECHQLRQNIHNLSRSITMKTQKALSRNPAEERLVLIYQRIMSAYMHIREQLERRLGSCIKIDVLLASILVRACEVKSVLQERIFNRPNFIDVLSAISLLSQKEHFEHIIDEWKGAYLKKIVDNSRVIEHVLVVRCPLQVEVDNDFREYLPSLLKITDFKRHFPLDSPEENAAKDELERRKKNERVTAILIVFQGDFGNGFWNVKVHNYVWRNFADSPEVAVQPFSEERHKRLFNSSPRPGTEEDLSCLVEYINASHKSMEAKR